MKNIEEISDFICDKIKNYWGNKVDEITIEEITDIPFNMLKIEVLLYQYLKMVVILEHSSLGFSVKSYGGNFKLLKERIEISEIDSFLKKIDDEIRLRIPDKYLKAKSWL